MNDDQDDSILEKNVATLLESGGDAPKLNDVSRARIRKQLVDELAVAVPPRRWPVRAVAVGLAATAAVAVIATVVVGKHPGGDGVAAGSDGQPALKLADGTTAVTAPGATVTVLAARRVRVTGEVLLDVAPGAERFVVETASGRVEVHGTRFVVDGEPQRTTAAVVRGEVALASDDGSVTLHAGEQGVAEPGRPPTRGPAPRLSHLVAWAQQARRQMEDAAPVHHGTLYAREPNMPWLPEQPLPITRLGVDIVVEDRVARVALDQTFHNNTSTDLEGMYRFAIPPDAALQRLAMYVDGKLTESAVVERMAARRIYEEQVYKRVDPALLEWAGTGRLNLRVYPVPAEQDKRLIVAYTQSLPRLYDDWTLTVPLPEVDQPVGDVDFTVRVAGCANCDIESTSHKIAVARHGDDATVTYHADAATIGDSLVLHVRDHRNTVVATTQRDGADRYLLVRAPADVAGGPVAYRPRTWVLLDDVSGSRDAMARRAQADLVDAFLRELDEDDRVAVVAFDVAARRQLAMTRVRDVSATERSKLRAALTGADTGVGATDLGVGLDAAVAELSGTAPVASPGSAGARSTAEGGAQVNDAMVVYLGDGVVSAGELHLDALRARLAGKAHFVGVGVGDAPDTQTLDALAGATGGFATTIDLADDLGWRAFDLVAALHTSRVTGVTARLVDAAGKDVAATAYLRAPQLADGEDIELVAKLPTTATVAALELSGTRDGAPWQQHVAVASPRDGAGYLPRLWAQRHIAARLLAKHEPVAVPACNATAKGSRATCVTEQEARDARDEVIRKDVVELGKKYFLLSRHTSLLVLENDAMYAQYGLTKGARQGPGQDTWAPYALPATIPVNKSAPTQVVAVAATDAPLVRAPLVLFQDPSSYAGLSRRDAWRPAIIDRESQDNPLATVGNGAGWHGSRGVDLAAGDLVEAKTQKGEDEVGADETARAASDKSYPEPDNKKDSDRSEAYGVEGGMAGSSAGDGDASSAPAVSAPATVAAEQAVTKLAETTEHERNIDVQGVYGARRLQTVYRAPIAGTLVPLHFVAASDPVFDDLTAEVPALVPGAIDDWRRVVGPAHRSGALLPIDRDAAALLARARDALPRGVYQWGDAAVAVDGDGNLGWTRTTEDGLAERGASDAHELTRVYPELGVAVRRRDTSRLAVALAMFPAWIGADDDYRTGFAVRAHGANAVALSRPQQGGKRGERVELVMTFDAAAHLVSIADASGHELVGVTWDGSGPVAARVDGRKLAASFASTAMPDAVGWGRGDTADAVTVELPMHAPSYWTAKLAALAPGSAEWRATQRQLLAALAAQQPIALEPAYRELAAHGGVVLGDLVLASGGAPWASPSRLDDMIAPLRGTVVARYLAAGRLYANGRVMTAQIEPGVIGALWALRQVAAEHAAGHGDDAADHVLSIPERAPALRFVGAAVASAWSYDGQRAGASAHLMRAWDAAALGDRDNLARAEAASLRLRDGSFDDAADAVMRYIDELDLDAPPASLPNASYMFQQSRRGMAGWQLAWARWRDRVLAGSSFAHVLALLDVENGEANDATRVVDRAVALAGDDVARVTAVADAAARLGQPALAESLLKPVAARAPSRALHQRLAMYMMQQGQTARALDELEAAQDAADDGDGSLPLATERAELAQIVTMARTVASQTSGAAREDVVRKAVRWGAKWRELAPTDAQVDVALGDLELAIGDTAEAWRQLSTAIERDPMSGDGYQLVANAFESQGKVAEAVGYWDQAVRIDQTNPTPRLREAQALAALGRDAEADKILHDIAGRSWHERWEGVVYEANELLSSRRH